MIKILICSVLVIMAIMLCGCDDHYVHGLEYCNDYVNDDTGVCELLYDREFIDKYQYEDGNFHYYGGTFTLDKTLLYLKYNDENYLLAKSDFLENMEYVETIVYNYKGFVFYATSDWAKQGEAFGVTPDSPNKYVLTTFKLMGYNDELNVLICIGYSNSKHTSLNNDEDFKTFVEDTYLEFYNFSDEG